MAKQVYFATLTMIAIAIVIYLLHEKIQSVWKEAHKDTTALHPIDEQRKRLMVSAYSGLPEQLDFCGEEVPLSLVEVKEKLDFELMVNAYMHANTLLILHKAQKYFPTIEPILKEAGIPEDFKYLAVIVSGLDNTVSPSGASGFWQLTKEVALQHGLVVNEEVDERLHLAKSTQVVCQHLQNAYQELGSWTLVAVDFGIGNGEIEQAIARQKVNNYYHLFLSRESNRFIFKMLALKEIMQNPQKYRFELKDSRDTIQRSVIKVGKTIPDLVAFAKEQGVSYKTLKNYNEWLLADRLTIKDTTRKWEICLPSQ
ncbi:MAG: lytic transglycosylase domain-containing protein [Thermoflexibacter sp.]